MKKIVVFLLVALFACNNQEKELLLAENKNQGSFYDYTLKFVLEKNHTFSFSCTYESDTYMKPLHITRTYRIKNDTIYFSNNKRFKSAVLKNGYLEFVNESFKIKIKQNSTGIDSGNKSAIPGDFTFFTFNENSSYPFKKGKNTSLSQKEIKKISVLIQTEMEREPKRFSRHFYQSEYYKQCIAIINEKNQKEVWINCISMKEGISGSGWKNQIIEVNDGGEYYFNLKINLSTGKVYDFYVNGEG